MCARAFRPATPLDQKRIEVYGQAIETLCGYYDEPQSRPKSWVVRIIGRVHLAHDKPCYRQSLLSSKKRVGEPSVTICMTEKNAGAKKNQGLRFARSPRSRGCRRTRTAPLPQHIIQSPRLAGGAQKENYRSNSLRKVPPELHDPQKFHSILSDS
jgi:hypothetical protein